MSPHDLDREDFKDAPSGPCRPWLWFIAGMVTAGAVIVIAAIPST